MKKIKTFAAAAVLAIAGPAFADCTSNSTLSLGTPGIALFGNSFSEAGNYTDCYTFDLGKASDTGGFSLTLDPILNKLNIDLLSVSLSGGSLGAALVDTTPGTFSFSSLAAGTYTLAVNALVTNSRGLWGGDVSYGGTIVSTAASVSPIPEPQTYALMLAGLGAIAWISRRRRML